MLVHGDVFQGTLGAVVDGTRYSIQPLQDTAQTQFYANSRGSIRFLNKNKTATLANWQTSKWGPDTNALWNGFFSQIQNWRSALCRMEAVSYPGPADPGRDAFVSASCWRTELGLQISDEVPAINTQPGGDELTLTMVAPPADDPPALAGSVMATWSRLNVPADVPYFLAISARSALTVPAGESGRCKNRWGGVVPVVVNVPVCLDGLLVATGRMLQGLVIVVNWWIGEVGSVPFAAGQASLRNVGAAPGWGLGWWGQAAWGA